MRDFDSPCSLFHPAIQTLRRNPFLPYHRRALQVPYHLKHKIIFDVELLVNYHKNLKKYLNLRAQKGSKKNLACAKKPFEVNVMKLTWKPFMSWHSRNAFGSIFSFYSVTITCLLIGSTSFASLKQNKHNCL